MTFVVGENCINCKHTDCVEVCPVITLMKDPLPDAPSWNGKPEKTKLLVRQLSE